MADDIKPAFGRDFRPFLWDERDLRRSNPQCDLHDLVRDRHLQIELHLDGVFEDSDIAILNVSAVFAQVNRNDVRPGQFGKCRRPNRVRFDRPACLPNGGNVIDVDAEFGHWGAFLCD